MDKTLPSPSRENYEELDGLSDEEIESRVCYVKPITVNEAVQGAINIFNKVYHDGN